MKKKHKWVLRAAILILLLSAALFMAGTFYNREVIRNVAVQSNTVSQNTAKYKTIGLIANNMQNKSTANIFSILKGYSRENENIRMLLYDSEAKADKQMLQLEEFIDMKVDGIIMSPVENSFSEASLNKLKSSGIPVILVDSDSSDSYFTCIVGPSSAQIGEAQAEYVAEKLDGNGTVLVFAGSPARKDSVARLTGFDNLIGKYPGIECIKIYDSLDMGTNLEQLQNTVKEHERIDGIVLQQNDISAQLIPFLRSLEYKPYIIGVDTTADILEVIKAGELDASIYINNSDIASGAYNTMIKIIQKEDVPRRKTIPHSLITTDNIDEFIQNNLNYKIK